jgi:kynureninase
MQPEDAIEIKRRDGEHNIRTEDVIAQIEELGDELALVLIGGVNYYTGVFDMKTITAAGHKAGAIVGWDFSPCRKYKIRTSRLECRFCLLVQL